MVGNVSRAPLQGKSVITSSNDEEEAKRRTARTPTLSLPVPERYVETLRGMHNDFMRQGRSAVRMLAPQKFKWEGTACEEEWIFVLLIFKPWRARRTMYFYLLRFNNYRTSFKNNGGKHYSL